MILLLSRPSRGDKQDTHGRARRIRIGTHGAQATDRSPARTFGTAPRAAGQTDNPRAIDEIPEPVQEPPIPVQAQRIAVVCPSWVGDTVMCTPVLRALRNARPSARITAVVRPGLDELLALREEDSVGPGEGESVLKRMHCLRCRREDSVGLLHLA